MSSLGEKARSNWVVAWAAICESVGDLTPERRELLQAVNHIGERLAEDYAWLERVEQDQLSEQLPWAQDAARLRAVAHELEDRGLVERAPTIGAERLRPTYQGLVWTTRRDLAIESRFIDSLLAEWESANVEFKREVHTQTADEKAELIKDVLGLANTQVAGQRWLIIGFYPKTHAYYGAPDLKLTQDHLEQLLSTYARPVPPIVCRVVGYRAGPVGVLEVRRERRDLPYSVKLSLGDKKRITAGDVFVRHGSQTVRADAEEIAALEEERAWAVQLERAAAADRE